LRNESRRPQNKLPIEVELSFLSRAPTNSTLKSIFHQPQAYSLASPMSAPGPNPLSSVQLTIAGDLLPVNRVELAGPEEKEQLTPYAANTRLNINTRFINLLVVDFGAFHCNFFPENFIRILDFESVIERCALGQSSPIISYSFDYSIAVHFRSSERYLL
jgi:hypothetical protein